LTCCFGWKELLVILMTGGNDLDDDLLDNRDELEGPDSMDEPSLPVRVAHPQPHPLTSCINSQAMTSRDSQATSGCGIKVIITFVIT
jgi:hypothetical protein